MQWFQSLKVKAGVAATAIFAVGLAVAGAVSFFAMSAISEQSHADQMSGSIKGGLEALKEVRARTSVYADFLARHPDVVAVVKSNDPKGASETGSASTQVLASAQALSSEGSKLKAEVARFVTTVRAA